MCFAAKAAITGRRRSLPERLQPMKALPGTINPTACFLAAAADEAKHKSGGECMAPSGQFAEQVVRDGSIVQRAKAILQAAQSAQEAVSCLARIHRREDFGRIAQSLGLQADRVQLGGFQSGQPVLDLGKSRMAFAQHVGGEIPQRLGRFLSLNRRGTKLSARQTGKLDTQAAEQGARKVLSQFLVAD